VVKEYSDNLLLSQLGLATPVAVEVKTKWRAGQLLYRLRLRATRNGEGSLTLAFKDANYFTITKIEVTDFTREVNNRGTVIGTFSEGSKFISSPEYRTINSVSLLWSDDTWTRTLPDTGCSYNEKGEHVCPATQPLDIRPLGAPSQDRGQTP
jgi:hypothetical protein